MAKPAKYYYFTVWFKLFHPLTRISAIDASCHRIRSSPPHAFALLLYFVTDQSVNLSNYIKDGSTLKNLLSGSQNSIANS